MSKRKGTYAELNIIKKLEAQGYLCVRSSASLGPFDIWAVRHDGVRLIQSKYGTARLSPKERQEIADVKVPPCVTKEYWSKKKYKKTVIQIIP